MQLNKEQIIEVLKENSRLFDVDGYPLKCIRSDDYDSVAGEILNLMQPNSDSQPLLQQTPCTALLPDEDVCDRCGVKMKNNGIFLWCPSCRQ